jgi:hypothetical protein
LGFKLDEYLANNDNSIANIGSDQNDLMIRMHNAETMVWFDVFRYLIFYLTAVVSDLAKFYTLHISECSIKKSALVKIIFM